MNAADAKVAAESARKRLAAEARLGGQYQAVVMAIHQAVRKGDVETIIKFKDDPHPGVVHALEQDGYEVFYEDDEDDENFRQMDISWGHY
jgi:hypothetical protein